jgi:Protein of unknown function (DUF3237)
MSYEKIFEYDLDITGVTDYGADMEALFTGRESAPLQGAQFDVMLAGPVKGRVTGNMRGIDYLRVRPDGRRELELRGTIETDDGNRIAFTAEGVGSPREGEPIVDLAVKIDLLTAAAAYRMTTKKRSGPISALDWSAPQEVRLPGVPGLEPIREVWIHDEWFAARRLSMMRIMARRAKAATVVA